MITAVSTVVAGARSIIASPGNVQPVTMLFSHLKFQ
jgi:hypothetical protein